MHVHGEFKMVCSPSPRASAFAVVLGMSLVALACGGQGTGVGEAPLGGSEVNAEESELSSLADGRLRDLGIECHLALAPGSTSQVEMTLWNLGDAAVSILERGTAWDGATSVFRVRSGDEEQPYLGLRAYRSAPLASEFRSLAPGEVMSVAYDVGQHHRLSKADTYSVELMAPVLGVQLGEATLAMQHDCGELTAELEAAPEPTLGVAKQQLFSSGAGCSATQLAFANLNDVYAQFAVPFARSLTANNAYWTRWFGPYSDGRRDKVAAAFTSMINKAAVYTIDCNQPDTSGKGCQDPVTVAWTLPSQSTTSIHLCSPFFTGATMVAQLGPGSAGILVHEKSHLEVSGTNDFAYGVEDCLALAASTLPVVSGKTILNGDTYGFFASDTYIVSAVLPASIAAL
jgi:hypothetical protein